MNLELLRQKIHAIEWQETPPNSVFSFGAQSIDEALPQGGLKTGCVHEWTGPYLGPLTGVCTSVLAQIAKNNKPVLWCSTRINVYPSGLLDYGLSPKQVIFAKLPTPKEVLWAIEEGLNTPQLCAVIAEVGAVSLSESRRLQLSAQKNGVTLFLIIDKKHARSSSSTSLSRWLVEPMPSEHAPGLWRDNGIGAPRFTVTLARYRGAITPKQWNLEWHAKTLSFNLLSEKLQITARA